MPTHQGNEGNREKFGVENSVRIFAVLLSLVCVCCGGSDDDSAADDGGILFDAGDTETEEALPPFEGLEMTGIDIYQAAKVPLMLNGGGVGNRVTDIVAGREALMRISVKRLPTYANEEVTVTLEFESPKLAPMSQTLVVSMDSTDGNLGSTINFELTPEMVTTDLKYKVSIVKTAQETLPLEWPWASVGYAELGALEGGGPIDLVVVPIRYNADGSGRLPDTSEAQLETIRKMFMRYYPVADVAIEVTSVVEWDGVVEAMGGGWEDLLMELMQFHQQNNPSRTDLYFGLFVPADSFMEYCAQGCVMGLSNWVQNANQSYAQVGIGVGYSGEISAGTMIHEVGHLTGRLHAPCQVPDADPSYPYSGGWIGSWGWDIVNDKLMDPATYYDYMSYCYPTWTSDYTFGAIFERLRALYNVAKGTSPQDVGEQWRSVRIGSDAMVNPGPDVRVWDTPSGAEELGIDLIDVSGRFLGTTTGYYNPFSNLGGGLVVFPEPPAGAAAVQLSGYQPILLDR